MRGATGDEENNRLTRDELRRARRFHHSRPSRARKLDEARPSKRITYDVEKWMNKPDRYDLPGVDTPDAAEWRRRLAKAMQERMNEVKKAPIAWCDVTKSKDRYAVVCWHDLGNNVYYPVMYGTYKDEFKAIDKLMKLQQSKRLKQSEFLETAKKMGSLLAKEANERFGIINVIIFRDKDKIVEVKRKLEMEKLLSLIAKPGKREYRNNVIEYTWYIVPQKIALLSDRGLKELARNMKIPKVTVTMFIVVDKKSKAAPIARALSNVKIGKCWVFRTLNDEDSKITLTMTCKEGKTINNNVTYFTMWLKLLKAVSEGFLEASSRG